MNNYLLFLDIRTGWNRYSCRETLCNYYRRNTRSAYNRRFVGIPVYFGHNYQVSNNNFVDRYLPFCKEIWGDRVKYELVNLKDITSSTEAINWYKSNPQDITLIKTTGLVNPLDISLILFYTWFGNFQGHTDLKRYFIAKKYSDLIPDYRKSLHCWNGFYNGPESYINHALYYHNNHLYDQINNLYLQHSGEVN